jgi:hypothetical protein
VNLFALWQAVTGGTRWPTSGWLGAPGDTETELVALQTSNGFLQPNVLVPRLLPAREVDWFRTAHQDTIDAWSHGAYLPTALQVSAVEHGGTAVYLLNPRVVAADGEWEAFYFAHWVPGVDRYPSFRALMEAERINWTPPSAPPPKRPSQWHALWSTLRWIFTTPRRAATAARPGSPYSA